MKKIGKFIKSNIKTVIAFTLGLVIAGGSAAVVSAISGSQVTYTDTNNIGATTVQGAIDKLYTLANQPKGKNNTVYFAYGEPTTSSTTNYTTLNKKTFIALNGGQKSVCIIRNSRLHCFDNNNYAIEKDHIQQVFSDLMSCNVSSSDVSCNALDFNCLVRSNGYVSCYDGGTLEGCFVTTDGSVYCG